MTTDIIETLDAIVAERSLLKHPFYQAWTAGTLPIENLRDYAKQYFHFEAALPTFLSAIHTRMEPGASRQSVLENLWDEEHGAENHLAHPYVDTAHRAALLYSFATLLVASFVQFSGWSQLVDLLTSRTNSAPTD